MTWDAIVSVISAAIWPNRWVRDPVALSSIVTVLATKAKLQDHIDVSLLTADVRGCSIPGDKIKENLVDLLNAYNSNCTVVGDKIVFYSLDKNIDGPVATADLGATDSESETDNIEILRKNEQELPRGIYLTAKNYDKMYEPLTVPVSRTQTKSQQMVEKNLDFIVFTSEGLVKAADTNLWKTWTERTTFKFRLPPKYLRYVPGDVLSVPILLKTEDTSTEITYAIRLTSVHIGVNFIMECEGVLHNMVSFKSSKGSTSVTSDPGVGNAGDTAWHLLNLPPLIDSHASLPGVYIAAVGPSESWLTAQVYRSIDDGASYQLQTDIANFCVIGGALTTLPAAGTSTWDTTSTLDVQVVRGSLSSKSDELVLAGANAFAVGTAATGWEIIQAANVELIGTKTYRLSRLLRGRRATEWRASTHAANESVIYLPTAAFLTVQYSTLNRDYLWKIVPNGQTLDNVSPTTFAVTGENMVPFSPVDLYTVVDMTSGDPDVTFNWTRRSRLGQVLTSGSEIPLGESTEKYHVQIFNASNVLVREDLPTTNFWVYSHSTRSVDLGSPSASMNGFTFKVAQVSSNVGDGRIASLALTTSNT